MAIKENPKYFKKFSLGHNGQSDYFDKIIFPFRKYISSVYVVPPEACGIPNARWPLGQSTKELKVFRGLINDAGIEFNLIYNYNGLEKPSSKTAREIRRITDFLQPDLVTVANSFTADIFLGSTDYKLNLSIIFDIDSLNQLAMLLEKDSGKQIVSYNIGRQRTYDLGYIKKVKQNFPELRLKLMVNEGCIFACPDQNFHSCSLTMSGGKIDNPEDIFFCGKLKADQQWRFLTGQYIPPQFLANYLNLVDEFKLGTRSFTTQELAAVLTEYINEEKITIHRAVESAHGGSLFFFSDYEAENFKKEYPEDFFKKRTNCYNKCHNCNYCRNILY